MDGVAHSDKAGRSRVVVLNVRELALEFAHRSRDVRRATSVSFVDVEAGAMGRRMSVSILLARRPHGTFEELRKRAPRPSPDRGAIRGA
jgi:hypothetical protein